MAPRITVTHMCSNEPSNAAHMSPHTVSDLRSLLDMGRCCNPSEFFYFSWEITQASANNIHNCVMQCGGWSQGKPLKIWRLQGSPASGSSFEIYLFYLFIFFTFVCACASALTCLNTWSASPVVLATSHFSHPRARDQIFMTMCYFISSDSWFPFARGVLKHHWQTTKVRTALLYDLVMKINYVHWSATYMIVGQTMKTYEPNESLRINLSCFIKDYQKIFSAYGAVLMIYAEHLVSFSASFPNIRLFIFCAQGHITLK